MTKFKNKKFISELSRFIHMEINPLIGQKNFVHEAWMKCADYGLLAINIPEKYGGLGFSLEEQAAVLLTLGYVCQDSGFVFALNNHLWPFQSVLLKYASESIKDQYLPQLINGSKIGCFALTESNAGSDYASMESELSFDSGNYLISVCKDFISNAPIADLFLTICKNKNSKGKQYSAVLLDKCQHSIHIHKPIGKMGLHSCPMGGISASQCRIAQVYILGDSFMGGNQIINYALEMERLFEFISHIGAMRRVAELCLGYTNGRKQYGVKLSEYQAVSHKIADMFLYIEIAERLMSNIIQSKEIGENVYYAISIFKLFVSEKYVEVCRNAMQILGAYGYSNESSIGDELNNALASTIYSGSSEIQRNIIYTLANNKWKLSKSETFI